MASNNLAIKIQYDNLKKLTKKLQHAKCNFTRRNILYLKRSLMKIIIHIWTKIKGLWIEKIEKKNHLRNFRTQKIDIQLWKLI